MVRLLFLFVFLSLGASAQPFYKIVLGAKGAYEVKGQLYYFQESGASLNIGQARQAKFKPLATTATSPSLGFNKNIHWFRIDLDNQSKQKEWLMELAYAPLDYIEVYFTDADGVWHKKASGD